MQGTNTNTILIVILTLIIVGFGAYWYTHRGDEMNKDKPSLEINLGGDK